MFYKVFKNHRSKLLYLLKLKGISKNIYRRLQIKKMSYMLTDLKKKIMIMFKVLKSIYIFKSKNI